jgi:iron complex outermembrane recepter protein
MINGGFKLAAYAAGNDLSGSLARHRRLALASVAISALLGFGVSSAMAQTTPPTQGAADETELDAIVVTATKTNQRLIDAPVSVSVISSEIIAATGATDFRELATLIPSVVFSQQQSAIQTNVGIRGVTTAGGSAALEPSVGIYIDGVFTDRTSIGISDFSDIAAVEVLRGPQSTLFGNASPAGIINFVTKPAERELGADLRVTVGNYGLIQTAGSITGPLAGDKLLGRFSFYTKNRNGYLENLGPGPDSNDADNWGVRGKLTVGGDGPLRATLTADYSLIKAVCCAPLFDNVAAPLVARFASASQEFPFVGTGVPFPHNDLDSLQVATDGSSASRQESYSLTLDARWDLGGHELASISSYRNVDQLGSGDIDFTALNLINFPRIVRTNEYFSQELRVVSPSEGRFTYLAGLYYFQRDYTEDSASVIDSRTVAPFGGNLVAARSPSGSVVKTKNYAAFAEGTFEIMPRLKLTAGLRYNYDDKFTTAFAERLRANGTAISPRQEIPLQFQNKKGGEWTWRGVLQYQLSDDWSSYASYTRGYKAFGINDDANLLRNVPGATFFFDSEEVDNYEIGTKGYIEPLRATVSMVLFYTQYRDFQSLSSFVDTTGTIRFFLQNAASLTSKGAELDIVLKPTDHWTISASATYLDATFDNFPNAQGVTGVIDLSGQPLRDAPKWSSSLVVAYSRPITDTLRVYGQTDLFYRSKVFTDQNLDPLLVQNAYAKINARLGIGQIDRGLSLEVWGRNLTNKITFGRGSAPVFGAVTNLLPLSGAPSFPTGAARVKFVEDPRTFGATLTYRY